PRNWSAQVNGATIEVGGVGTFFEGDQNTVYLGVESPAVQAVWDKPDYPGQYIPHLTIYDGASRQFAESLRDLLKEKDLRFTFLATDVEPVVVGNGPSLLIAWYDPSELAGLLESPPQPA